MNSIIIVFISFVLFFMGFRFYGRKLERIWRVNPEKSTPAVLKQDGIDYVSARHWTVLFGHHFASIAGAGPILGPVIAAMIWGWLPVLLWIVFGTIFLGGVHDFSALMISLRHDGKSLADVAEKIFNHKTKIFFAVFIFLSLLLVMAVFSVVTAQTLTNEPRLVIPTFGLMIVAVFVGIMMYRLKWNPIIVTLLGLVLLAVLLILGYYMPVTLNVSNPLLIWIIVLLIYAFIASVIPVNILLQPRDYLSTFILVFGLFLGYLGLIISRPQMHTPAFIKWTGEQGALWPMLSVIVACGAISGFHSLIAGGTTSKQIANEKHAKGIGYGAMILEGVLALLALICVTAGLYWEQPAGANGLVYPELMKSGDWIGTFSSGFGQITKPVLGPLGTVFAAIMLNTFVLTTLDSATRINRYLTEELFGEGVGIKIFKNRYFATAVIVGLTFWLAIGNYKAIWPIFGSSNQLVAALVLLIVSVYLISLKKNSKHVLYPAIFMLATALAAILWQSGGFLKQKNILLLVISCLLFVLAVFMVKEVIRFLKKYSVSQDFSV